MQTKHLRILLLIVITVVVGACGTAISTQPPDTPSSLLATNYISGLTATVRAERETASAQALTDMPRVTHTAVPTSTANADQLALTEASRFETIVALAATTTSQGVALIITATPIDPIVPIFTPTLCAQIVNCPTSTSAPTNTPEPEPIIITITRAPTVPTWTLYPTWTFLPPFTSSPTATPCPCPSSNNVDLSDDAMRATEIIAGATTTQQVILTATAQASIQPTLDPFQPTATPLASATPTLTPTRAFTDAELEILRAQWLNELETAAGFSHRALTASVDRLVQSITNRDIARARNFHLQPSVMRTEFDGSAYVAVITTSNFIWHNFSQLLLFKIINGVPTLLPEMLREGWILSFHEASSSDSGSQGEFVDYNQNGFPEVIIYINDTGNCPSTGLMILELTSDGEFVDIAPNAGGFAFDWADINGDDIFELQVVDRIFIPLMSFGCNPLFVNRYFGWNGSAYEDISPTLDESFYPAIEEFWSSIDADEVCILPDVAMYQMLASYWVQGRLEEGWLRLQRVLEWRLCSQEVRADTFADENMLDLVIWVGWILESLHLHPNEKIRFTMAKPHFRRISLLTLSVARIVLALMVCAAICFAAIFVQLSTTVTTDPALDPDQMRATQIIAGATATQAALNNPVLRWWGSLMSILNPPPPTATPRRGIVNYPTSVPTLTSTQLQQLHTQWLTEIETAAGFSHPIFEEAVDNFLQDSSSDYIADMQRQPPQVQRITFENTDYVAVVPMPLYPPSDAGEFLLFGVANGIYSLILQGDGLDFRSSTLILSDDGFDDYNGNGYPDIALFTTMGVTCAQPVIMTLLEIREEGEVVDITPVESIDSIQTAQVVDLNGDGVMEIERRERFNTPYVISGSCRFVFVNRYFAWDGTAYQDISSTLDESFYPAIGSFWESIEAEGACLLPSPLMYEMFLSEYVRGSFVDAWERLQPQLRWDECSSETLMEHSWEMVALEDWVTSYLPQSTPSP